MGILEDAKSADFSEKCTCVLAMASVLPQEFGTIYDPEKAIQRGTLFPELDLPFYAGGDVDGR